LNVQDTYPSAGQLEMLAFLRGVGQTVRLS